MKLPDITLPTNLKERLAQGHPWVYRNHVPDHVRLPSGAWARVRCGGWTGYALWDDASPIALRIFSDRYLPDTRWVREQVRLAWELREPLREAGCTAYRWLFGEADGMPGITVDLYGEYAVMQIYMDDPGQLVQWVAAALRDTAPLRGIVLRQRAEGSEAAAAPDERAQPAATRSSMLWGEAPPRDLVVVEHGLRFSADIQGGQKTGLFLDHRENRRYVEGISQGREVLNCFAYTGAFSLYALRGGAHHVVSADIGKGLAESADTNIALNGLDAGKHRFETADCFVLLGEYAEQGRQFDLVVLDPPSFAKNKQNRFAAVRAYTRLNALAMRCVRPGGMLASASCTSQVGPEPFKEMLAAAAAAAGRQMQITHEAGQPLDHPVPPQFPEGRYLKFVAGRVR